MAAEAALDADAQSRKGRCVCRSCDRGLSVRIEPQERSSFLAGKRSDSFSMKSELTSTAMKKERYVGLDVHEESVTVAVAQGGRDGEVRLYGTISNNLHAIEKLLRRVGKTHGANPRREVCSPARSPKSGPSRCRIYENNDPH